MYKRQTLLKAISGQIRPTGGCVHLGGRHVNGTPPHRLARIGLCTIPEGRGVFPNLTVRENLKMDTYSGSRAADIEARAFERFPRLGERRNQLAGTMSGGEQQMLAMARAVVTDPSLLLVDEPSMGLSPLVVGRVYEVLGQLAADGMAVLLVEQFARTALGVADYAAVMAHGTCLLYTSPSPRD